MKQARIWAGVAVCSLSFYGGGITSAAEVYRLDPIVVTATRTEKKDLDVPASTTIITAQDIERKGYTSVFDALEHTVGVDSYSYSPQGEDLGGSVSRFYIRGMDKGTLVLVNGAPVNIMNYSSTEGIPIDAVEKIEIIKGSNSVLYGAEAMGGVVNIITKKGGAAKTTVTGTAGNYRSGYQVTTQSEGLLLSYEKTYYNEFDKASTLFPAAKYGWKDDKGQKDSFYGSAQITDAWSLSFSRVSTDKHRHAAEAQNGAYTGRIYESLGRYDYESTRNNVNLVYDDKDSGFKSVLAYNNRWLDSTQVKYETKDGQQVGKTPNVGTNYNAWGLTFDNQKTWRFGKGDALTAGVGYRYDRYRVLHEPNKKIGRRSYSAYASWNHNFTEKLSGIFGVRGEFVQGNGWDEEHHVFLPQVQFLYKVNDKWSWYTNVGKSFDMPAINSKYYSDKIINHSLKPQSGWTYEVGSKYISGKDSLKVALFHMRLKDKFIWVKEGDIIPGGDQKISVQINGDDFRNTGLEADYVHRINDAWSINVGASLSNPEVWEKTKWVQFAAKLQMSAGFSYEKDKWMAGLQYFLTADREDSGYTMGGSYISGSSEGDHVLSNRAMLNGVIRYMPNQNQSLTLNMYNLLDRDNPINKSENLDLPFNWTLSYQYAF